ncbi:MAG TPA: diguanylate cyclase [Gallionellaceae bacterium]|nr:diguanylate cyclase [Gallionellaceae bacterium]
MISKDIEAKAYFVHTLEWIMAVMHRYSSPIQFGLVHIAHGNGNEIGETYGAQEALKQLVAVTDALRNAFRKTDLVARDGSDFWVIIPYTPATEKIFDKVANILQDAVHDGLHIVEREISIFSLPMPLTELGNDPNKLTAIEFLSHLKENRHRYRSHHLCQPSSV